MKKLVLYRAAADDCLIGPSCFAPERKVAEAYRSNPGFGGANLYRAVVELDASSNEVLDLMEMSSARRLERLVSLTGLSHPGAIGAEEWVMHDRVADALVAEGYTWVRVPDSYPVGAETWVWLGSGEEPELEAVS